MIWEVWYSDGDCGKFWVVVLRGNAVLSTAVHLEVVDSSHIWEQRDDVLKGRCSLNMRWWCQWHLGGAPTGCPVRNGRALPEKDVDGWDSFSYPWTGLGLFWHNTRFNLEYVWEQGWVRAANAGQGNWTKGVPVNLVLSKNFLSVLLSIDLDAVSLVGNSN